MNKRHIINSLLSRNTYLLLSSLIIILIAYLTAKPNRADTKPHDGLCQVNSIIDGDSLTVTCAGRQYPLRLMHIDAPELGQQPWGKKAKMALQALAGQSVQVAFHGHDVYARELAIIYASTATPDMLSINEQLVQQGFARVYRRYQPPPKFVAAMKAAKRQQRGIWQQDGLHQDPQRYRRLAN